MNAKLQSDGTGRDTYVLQNMRDMESNGKGSLLRGFSPQFASTRLRDYAFDGSAHAAGRLRGRSCGALRVSHRLAASEARRRQHVLCQRLAVPIGIQRARQSFDIEAFLHGKAFPMTWDAV
mmetsp:Transcript_120598/g.240140  ORF Transcript_120598/g.240140 Transcript_120598/m.240140 type:complete len:121 (+) Transcript_120598:45-407(+)|eukprot:CAMPEP_0172721434 /NCGR_PEP_ID=MMETSP1074-20121228/79101_1 /TAXON_ID=2916 /ORGANISM="Ceratium fusus, Strain PA161109" /LENGTH=120 /DNA_ID=CAMNT_0013547177 /DNA_START=44 /DNA_END=406 /DNA_ORIENTATION=-